jgi:hypothetical protein
MGVFTFSLFNVSISDSGFRESNDWIVMNLEKCEKKLLCFNFRYYIIIFWQTEEYDENHLWGLLLFRQILTGQKLEPTYRYSSEHYSRKYPEYTIISGGQDRLWPVVYFYSIFVLSDRGKSQKYFLRFSSLDWDSSYRIGAVNLHCEFLGSLLYISFGSSDAVPKLPGNVNICRLCHVNATLSIALFLYRHHCEFIHGLE